MEFCQKCDSRIIPMPSQPTHNLACPKCGYMKASGMEGNRHSRVARQMSEESVVVVSQEEAELRVLPTVKVECPKCSGNRAYYWTTEIGKEEDTIQVYVFRCTRCRHAWRERE